MGGDRGACHMGLSGFGIRVSIIGGAGFGGKWWEYKWLAEWGVFYERNKGTRIFR